MADGTRELYRLDAECLPSAGLKAAHEATKANDYAAWLQACQVHGLRFRVAYSERPSGRYADEITRSITGLKVQGEDLAGVLELVTRQDAWRIAPRKQERPHGDAAAPGLTKARDAAGVSFQFRDIRAKAATDAGDLSHSQVLLGHKRREMTEHYVRQRVGGRVRPLR